jgi:hypothetical protein
MLMARAESRAIMRHKMMACGSHRSPGHPPGLVGDISGRRRASAGADSVVPANERATKQYARVYRSINHGASRKLCERLRSKNSQSSERTF